MKEIFIWFLHLQTVNFLWIFQIVLMNLASGKQYGECFIEFWLIFPYKKKNPGTRLSPLIVLAFCPRNYLVQTTWSFNILCLLNYILSQICSPVGLLSKLNFSYSGTKFRTFSVRYLVSRKYPFFYMFSGTKHTLIFRSIYYWFFPLKKDDHVGIIM